MGNILPNSKSQAAIFIIIALIIILSGVLYFFYQRQSVEQEVDVVQPEISPVKLYVENCIKSIAEDGLETIGLTGGYIAIPESIGSNPSAYLTSFPESGFKIPYWWHDGIEAVPAEDFINRQLASHVQSELKSCINNFEPFASSFEISELDNPIVGVQFNENDVSVRLKYPLEIISRNGDVRQLVQNFNYILPIRFKKVYGLAKAVMERENADYFLEKKTIDLYSMDTDIPTTDMEATCSQKTWQLSSIKQKLQTLLRVNLPYIRIKGTDYNPNSYVPNPKGKSTYADSYYQHHYIWEIGKDEKKHKNMKVAFAYENWPMEMFARPSSNGILRSNSQKGNDMLSFFCLHTWHFTYDVEYPVLATVNDQETDKNKAYQFSFSFKVAVDHNQPGRQAAGTALFESTADVSSDEFCSDVRNEITVFTVNNATGEDIKDVNLTFICGRFYCDIGASGWLSFGAAAGLARRLPYCVNGVVRGVKNGYAEAKSFVQTDIDGRSYVLPLNPVKGFRNFKIIKHPLSNPSLMSELSPNEKASIIIKGKDNSFEGFAAYPKETDIPFEIPDGKDAAYEITIYLIDGQNLIGGYFGEWKVGREMLGGAESIIFHVLELASATDDERALFIAGLGSYSKNIPQPELK